MTEDPEGRSLLFEKLQQVAVGFAAVTCLLGVLASAGCSPIPPGPVEASYFLHPVLLVLGLATGWLTALRKVEIDRWRFATMSDQDLTMGERQHAHREAERQIRVAGISFLFAAIGAGYWLAYQFRDPENFGVADLMILTPVLAFIAGLIAGILKNPSPGR